MRFERLAGFTYAGLKAVIRARPESVVMMDVERLPTAAASFALFASVASDPGNDGMILRMGGVGLRIEGRTSAYDLFRMDRDSDSALYAVDTKDDDFVASIRPNIS
jgi:hypothetical protein